MRRSEYLWHWLSSYALDTEFSAVWVDWLDLDELAQRVDADFRQARRCVRDELADEVFDIHDATVIWADRLTDDWLQIIEFWDGRAAAPCASCRLMEGERSAWDGG